MSDLMKDPVATLREALEASVARIPTFETAVNVAQERLRRELTKVEKLRELVALYEADEVPSTATQLPLTNLPAAPQQTPAFRIERGPLPPLEAARDSKKARMVMAVTELLRLRGSVHRKAILENLVSLGLMGHESNPLAHLAAFLSNERDKFASDGAGNFSLRHVSIAPDPQPAENAGDAGVDDAAINSATLNPDHEHAKGGVFHEPAAQR